jgi:hypothetical protein
MTLCASQERCLRTVFCGFVCLGGSGSVPSLPNGHELEVPPAGVCTCKSANEWKEADKFLPPTCSAEEKTKTSNQLTNCTGVTKNKKSKETINGHNFRKHYLMYSSCSDVRYCTVCLDQGLFRPSRYVCCICPDQPAFCSSLNCFVEFHNNNNYEVMTAPNPARSTDKFKVEALRLL